ncbi:hypothetical protein B0H19DRAFT_1274453 [Mycena capillaripes]|nr:hypothetical protein B0H19DRAFT_1274453 [Mycena capillaripes]
MHFTFALIMIGFVTRVLAQTNRFTFFTGVVDPDTQALGLQARVNGVDQYQWFASNEAEWFAIEVGPFFQSKAGQIAGGDDTAIIFEYNQTAPSPILEAEFTNLGIFNEYNLDMSFSYTPLPDAAFRDTTWSSLTFGFVLELKLRIKIITAQQDDATNYVPSHSPTEPSSPEPLPVLTSSPSRSIPVDALFPLQFTITTVTYVLSDALGITFAAGPNGPPLFTSSTFNVFFCFEDNK